MSTSFRTHRLLALLLLLPAVVPDLLAQSAGSAEARSLHPLAHLRRAGDAPAGAVRIAHNPEAPAMVMTVLVANGDVYTIDLAAAPPRMTRTDSAGSDGLAAATGMAYASDGTLYLVGNRTEGSRTQGIVMRGVMRGDGSGRIWTNVARTALYPRSNTNYDHTVNGITVSPDDTELFVSSGSRTDHGEIQSNGGLYPGLREVPLTSAVFRLPAQGENLVLPNDEDSLLQLGYLFADGTRNTFDLAFEANGRLFGAENSGDRDDPDELNLLQEFGHYGFPWRMGTDDTPQQFRGYDPAADRFVNKESYGYTNGFYYNDSTYPPRPRLSFIDPVANIGPDANMLRDSATGNVVKASVDAPLGTFTPHRSPLGLVFDKLNITAPEFRGHGFITSWTDGRPGGSNLLVPFNDPGQDVLDLTLSTGTNGRPLMVTRRIAEGFDQPIDMEIVGNRLYVLEYGNAHRIWEIAIEPGSGVAEERAPGAIVSGPTPNPCTGVGVCTIRTPHAGRVRAVLHDALGRRVAVLADDVMEANSTRNVVIDAAALPSGPYRLSVEGATFRASTRVDIVH